MEPTEITAGTIHLRPPRPGDGPALVAACQDPEIVRWTRVPSPYGEAQAADYVARADRDWAAGSAAHFVVVEATTGALLGTTLLMLNGMRPDDRGLAEVGYWVSPEARGRGVARRAVGATCRYGFGALDLARISWLAQIGNDASRRVAEAVGFTMEGTLRQVLPGRTGRVDCWIGSLLAGEPIG